MSERGLRAPKPGRPKSRRARTATPVPAELPWSVPVQVAEIPEAGRRFELTADAATRDAVARTMGVVAVPGLQAVFDVARLADHGARVRGTVSAVVEQNCVVTLDPVTNRVEEPVDLVFIAPGTPQREIAAPGESDVDDPPETLQDGAVDLGAVATEFLMLGIDPYPRKPDASFETPQPAGDPAAHPFAALAALKGDSGVK